MSTNIILKPKMKYQIKEVTLNSSRGEVIIQCKPAWGCWRNIWRRKFALVDRDYALMCAEDLKEHLEADI